MDGKEIDVTADEKTGTINIQNVTGDIEITATSKTLEIQTTEPIISTSTTATTSTGAGKVARGTAVYIRFTATLNVTGGTCTIDKTIPYKVIENGKYTFIITGTYDTQTITKELIIEVNQYAAPSGLVQYDAGDWTKEEITALQSKSLYAININKTTNKTYRLDSTSGLVFTFGGFTYKGDTVNSSAINAGTIITSRNQSVSPQSGYGTPKYNGWQLLQTTTKTDSSGNIIKNADGSNRIYVTKIIHAGSPENFAHYANAYNGSKRAEYLFSNGTRQTKHSTLSSGKKINPRNWDMYKDKELNAKGYIKQVYSVTYSEVVSIDSKIRITGAEYWTATARRRL